MDTEWLRVFRVITEHTSLSAAARSLGCSQPTLSATVQRLEAHFETTLLLRTSRGVEVLVWRCMLETNRITLERPIQSQA